MRVGDLDGPNRRPLPVGVDCGDGPPDNVIGQFRGATRARMSTSAISRSTRTLLYLRSEPATVNRLEQDR